MPARRQYPLPPEGMRDWLLAARARGEGFDAAWSAALRAPSVPSIGIYLPNDTAERRMWLAAFRATRNEWESAYEGAPSRLSSALARMTVDEALADDWSRQVCRVERELVAA